METYLYVMSRFRQLRMLINSDRKSFISSFRRRLFPLQGLDEVPHVCLQEIIYDGKGIRVGRCIEIQGSPQEVSDGI
jgi:hypothetical protein